mmetsp:Transcript_4698/g.5384  ORF Transcript_4698/g.5384 Transcript_4698/m.5384 type:complete len:149 (+) Transcript_4698:410-856(+)
MLVHIPMRHYPEGSSVCHGGEDVINQDLDQVKDPLVCRLHHDKIIIVGRNRALPACFHRHRGRHRGRESVDSDVVPQHEIQQDGKEPSHHIPHKGNSGKGHPSVVEDLKDSPEGRPKAERSKVIKRGDCGWFRCFGHGGSICYAVATE